MKKVALMFVTFTIMVFLFVTSLPCQAQDNVLYGCAKMNKGTLRLVSKPTECLKSEYSITMYGTIPQEPQTQTNAMYGCAKSNKGALRLVIDPRECLKSEYSVTLYRTSSQQPQNPLPSFQGELCWSMHITEDTHPPAVDVTGLMRVGVTYMESANYSLQGVVTVTAPDGNLLILDGSAVIVGNDVFMNLNFSSNYSSEPDQDVGTLQIRLDKSTLSGTVWSSVRQFDTVTREFEHYYNAGTATLTTCP